MNHAILAQHPFKCSTTVQMRFNDIDALGHVNNSVYFQFFDLAKTDYYANIKVDAEINWSKPALIIVNVNCAFLAPTLFKEPIAVLSQCTHLGDKSITMLQHVINTQTQQLKATCETVLVNIDPVTNQPATIPDVWRKALIAFEGHE